MAKPALTGVMKARSVGGKAHAYGKMGAKPVGKGGGKSSGIKPMPPVGGTSDGHMVANKQMSKNPSPKQ